MAWRRDAFLLLWPLAVLFWVYTSRLRLLDISLLEAPTADFSSSAIEQITPTGNTRDTLLVNVWIGSAMPDYFPAFIQRIRQNPSLSFLLISTFDTPEFCPRQGKSAYFTHKRHQVYCAETHEIIQSSAAKLCDAWRCDDNEARQVHAHLGNYLRISGQTWNNLKPVYPVLFGHLFESLFDNQFSHWFRIDLDVFLGRWNLLPSSAFDYDVITFAPGAQASWAQIWLKGYLTGFRNDARIARQWLRMRMFSTPKAFCAAFGSETFDPIMQKGAAVDEGAQSVALLRDAPRFDDISWIVLPGLLAVDLDMDGDATHAVALLDNRVLRVPADASKALIETLASLEPDMNDYGVRVGTMQLTQKCPLSWLAREDRLCLQKPSRRSDLRRVLDAGFQVQIARARHRGPRAGEITATVFPERGLGHGTHMLAFHFQASKHQGLQYGRMVKPGELVLVGRSPETGWRWWMASIDGAGHQVRRYGDPVKPYPID